MAGQGYLGREPRAGLGRGVKTAAAGAQPRLAVPDQPATRSLPLPALHCTALQYTTLTLQARRPPLQTGGARCRCPARSSAGAAAVRGWRPGCAPGAPLPPQRRCKAGQAGGRQKGGRQDGWISVRLWLLGAGPGCPAAGTPPPMEAVQATCPRYTHRHQAQTPT